MTETKKANNATKKDVAAAQAAQNIPETEKMPFSRFGKQETFKASNGNEYVFQFPGTKKAQEILDSNKNAYGIVVDSAYYEDLWKTVIIEPKGIDWDYWDENGGYREVMGACDNFLARML